MLILEKTISEHHYTQGENLLDQGAVLELLEIENNLWSVMVKDKGIIEVEILNPITKSQKSTCECYTYKEEKSCPHIAAALLHIRKIQTEKEVEKNKSKRKKYSFNTKSILDSIDETQLKSFVRSYAKKDKNFSTMLKATFTKSINLEDNYVKYHSILNSLIKPISTEKLKSNTADLRLALKVIDEFDAQIEDCLSINLYNDALTIIEATLPKLHYLYRKYSFKPQITIDWIVRFHEYISFLYKENLAPKFKTQLDEIIFDLSTKSYFTQIEEAKSLYFILDKNKRKKVKTKLLEYYNQKHQAQHIPENEVATNSIFIISNDFDKINSNEDVIKRTADYLIKHGYNASAVSFIQYFLETQGRNRKLEKVLIEAYENLGEIENLIKLSIEIYVKYNDVNYYRLLKEKFQDWTKISNRIIQKIQELQPSTSFAASFYFNEQMENQLLETLEKELDLNHIMKYDSFLYKSNFVALERIYHKATAKYLDTHLGNVANHFIEEILTHLSNKKAFKMEISLRNFIATSYPHRSSFTSFS